MTHYVVTGEILQTLFGEPDVGTVVALEPPNKTPWWVGYPARLFVDATNAGLNHDSPALATALATWREAEAKNK